MARPGRGYPQKGGGLRGKVESSSLDSLRSVGRRREPRCGTSPTHSVVPIERVTHMAVTRLRTRRDAGKRATLEAVLDMLGGVAGAEDVSAFVERKLAAGRGWKFFMVDPVAYAGVVRR